MSYAVVENKTFIEQITRYCEAEYPKYYALDLLVAIADCVAIYALAIFAIRKIPVTSLAGQCATGVFSSVIVCSAAGWLYGPEKAVQYSSVLDALKNNQGFRQWISAKNEQKTFEKKSILGEFTAFQASAKWKPSNDRSKPTPSYHTLPPKKQRRVTVLIEQS